MPDPESLHDVAALLRHPARVAVLGAHPDPSRAAHYVPRYLLAVGWHIIPVNATRTGQSLFGEPVRASLADAGPIDVINVYRRSSALPDHLAEIEASGCPVVWLQSGIRHDGVARALRASGITVIQDRCMLADHRALAQQRGG